MNNDVDYTGDNIRTIKSMEDLARTADELVKPIFYKHSDDYKEIRKFFIVSEDNIYIWDVQKGAEGRHVGKPKKLKN